MAKSAPHIYLSALPFAPTCSLHVSSHYSTSFPRILHVERRTNYLSWPSLEMTISNFGEFVLSVAYSSDGQHASSSQVQNDHTEIRVWNAMTGETAAVLLSLGHTDPVRLSVAFSPDGRHIVSGSYDRTIRVWNAMEAGETAAGPFSLDTEIGSGLWHSRQMDGISSQVPMIEQFVCGMP